MNPSLSANTQAILLLTAPLIVGRAAEDAKLLTPGEYKRLALHLREIRRQPADLVSNDAAATLDDCRHVIDQTRLQRLLGRGFQLSQAVERWQSRAIWVVSRADPEYPRRLKVRFREDAPAVIHGCGDRALLESGGLAVVGSRHVDDVLIGYAKAVGRLAAHAGCTLVSGGARGIDQAAMQGALDSGGRSVGVLADSLEKAVMTRHNRNLLLDGQLVLISPFDPSAGFNVGNAMQRNKLIYALADAALVVSSDHNKGGTWAGAVEQLDRHRFLPVYVRAAGEPSVGLDALRNKGAIAWPEPKDTDEFHRVFSVSPPVPETGLQPGLELVPGDLPITTCASQPAVRELPTLSEASAESESSCASESLYDAAARASDAAQPTTSSPMADPSMFRTDAETAPSPAETLYNTVRAIIERLLTAPKTESEIADALSVSTPQAKAWLQRMVDEGAIEKREKPAGYVIRQKGLFG